MDSVADAFRALANPTRLRLLKAILNTTEAVCVCELVDALGLPQYQVSRHLGLLKRAGWLESERRGTWIYYRVSDVLAPWQAGTLKAIAELDMDVFRADEGRLQNRLLLRKDGLCVIGYETEGANQKEAHRG